jgi:ABC-2 type transport system permease protein
MSWQAVARKDFQDAIRSWWLWGLSAVFITFFTASAYFFADVSVQAGQQQQVAVSTNTFLGVLASVTRLLIPLTAVVIAYASIVGERESGTLRILLSLPNSRADVVIGKLLGRGAVVTVPVLLGFTTALVVFPLTGIEVKLVSYLGFALLTALLGFVFVALSMGVSAAVSTSRRAVIGTFGVYFLFTLMWGQLTSAVIQRVAENTDWTSKTLIELFLFVRHLNPMAAYSSLTVSLTSGSAVAGRTSIVGGLQGKLFAQQLGNSVPLYLSDPVVLGILLAWVVIPLGLGYRLFERADL